MIIYQCTPSRRIVQHDDEHYDIEELYVIAETDEEVWAVIYCGTSPIGETMNGYTQSTDLETRVNNLFEQIPQEYHLRAVTECYGEDDHDFERKLTAYVLHRVWETYDHPVNEAEFVDGFCDPDLKQEQLTGYFGKVKVTTSKEWDKRHLYSTREEQAGAADRRKAAGFQEWGGDTNKV